MLRIGIESYEGVLIMSANPSRLTDTMTSILLLLPVLLVILGRAPAVQSATGDIQLSYKDNLLTIKAQEADIKTILLKISDETGVFVQFPQSMEEQVSVELVGAPLSNALKKLLCGLNHAIIYFIDKENQSAEVTQIYVFEQATKGPTGAISGISSPKQERSGTGGRILHYEQRIKSLNKRLSRLDANSPQAQIYSREIQSYRNTLEKLKEQQ